MFDKVELKLPKRLQKYFGSLEREDGLIDDCKYMLYFAPGYAWAGEYPCLPVKSKKEAIYFLESAMPEVNYDEKLAEGVVEPRRDDYEEEAN